MSQGPDDNKGAAPITADIAARIVEQQAEIAAALIAVAERLATAPNQAYAPPQRFRPAGQYVTVRSQDTLAAINSAEKSFGGFVPSIGGYGPDDEDPVPLSVLSAHTLVFGNTGSGKSNTVMRLAERLLEAGQHVVVIDPTDVWWGLTKQADGETPAFDISIYGGDHSPHALPLDQGEALGAELATGNRSAIFSLKKAGRRADGYEGFLTDLLISLHRNKTAEDGKQLFLVLDEAHLLAPSRTRRKLTKEESDLREAITDLMTGSRSSGLNIVLITQRPVELDKTTRTQVETVVVHRLNDADDREAAAEAIGGARGVRRAIERDGQNMPSGVAWIRSVHVDDLPPLVRFPLRKTFDSAPTLGKKNLIIEKRRDGQAATARQPETPTQAEPAPASQSPGPERAPANRNRGARFVLEDMAPEMRAFGALYNEWIDGQLPNQPSIVIKLMEQVGVTVPPFTAQLVVTGAIAALRKSIKAKPRNGILDGICLWRDADGNVIPYPAYDAVELQATAPEHSQLTATSDIADWPKHGLGEVSLAMLAYNNIETFKDLAALDEKGLTDIIGVASTDEKYARNKALLAMAQQLMQPAVVPAMPEATGRNDRDADEAVPQAYHPALDKYAADTRLIDWHRGGPLTKEQREFLTEVGVKTFTDLADLDEEDLATHLFSLSSTKEVDDYMALPEDHSKRQITREAMFAARIVTDIIPKAEVAHYHQQWFGTKPDVLAA